MSSRTATDPGRALRTTLGRFATGVAVVTTLRDDGTLVGRTVNSFASVSLDPPLVLWCLRRTSSVLLDFLHNPEHEIHVLAAGQEELAHRFAGSLSGPCERPATGAAHLTCRLRETFGGGDHVVLLSEVTAHRAWERPPLVFLDGAYTPAR